MKYAISACLMGINCKYSGGNNANKQLLDFFKDKDYITICPEVSGGLPTPRACCEIVKGRVMNTKGEDVTNYFVKGANIELQRLLDEKVDIVILQPRSPSCGKGYIYDGTFQGKLISGNGIFAQLCEKQGIEVWNSEEFIQKRICFRNL